MNSGLPIHYQAWWGRAEPNNYHGNEYCLEIKGAQTDHSESKRKNRIGNWNDEVCAKKRKPLCQILS